jgi:hypothetical protein
MADETGNFMFWTLLDNFDKAWRMNRISRWPTVFEKKRSRWLTRLWQNCCSILTIRILQSVNHQAKMIPTKNFYGQGLGYLACTSLISTRISSGRWTVVAWRTSSSCHNLVAPKTADATSGCLKTNAESNSKISKGSAENGQRMQLYIKQNSWE